MSRRVVLDTKELGSIELLLLHQDDLGVVEAPFDKLLGTEIYQSVVTKAPFLAVEHALRGYSFPLTNLLTPDPKVCLSVLVPKGQRSCELRGRCNLYDPQACLASHPMRPYCFVPGGLQEDQVLPASMLIDALREHHYIIEVLNDDSGKSSV